MTIKSYHGLGNGDMWIHKTKKDAVSSTKGCVCINDHQTRGHCNSTHQSIIGGGWVCARNQNLYWSTEAQRFCGDIWLLGNTILFTLSIIWWSMMIFAEISEMLLSWGDIICSLLRIRRIIWNSTINPMTRQKNWEELNIIMILDLIVEALVGDILWIREMEICLAKNTWIRLFKKSCSM